MNEFVNKFKGSRVPILRKGNITASTSLEKSNLLNEHFSEITRIPCENLNLPAFAYKTNCRISSININENDVLLELKNIKTKKSAGPDKISPLVLKKCAIIIAPFCTILFKKILEVGSFPSTWKIANVVPIYKSGDSSDPSNYRPISLTSVLCKVFEKLVHRDLYRYIISNNLLSKSQSGFIKQDCCSNRLAYLLTNIYEIIENNRQAVVVFLDIKKAFDKVWHEGLIYKLKMIGIEGILLKLLTSYLNNRKQCVVIDGECSTFCDLFAGVPEGGVLSTLLFIIFINDVIEYVQSHSSLFADDTSLYTSISTLNDINLTILQRDLLVIENWAKAWCVEFNASKCKCMVFCRKNTSKLSPNLSFFDTKMEVVEKTVYLGLTLDSKLTWGPHIDSLVNRTKFILNVLKQYKYSLGRNTLKVIYIIHIKSIISYCDFLLTNLSIVQQKRLESLQYQAMLTVCGCTFGSSEMKLRQELGWFTLDQFRKFHRLVFLYKVQNELTPVYLKDILPAKKTNILNHTNHTYRLRTVAHRQIHPLDYVEQIGTQQFMNSPIQVAVREWNLLPAHVRESLSLEQFKSKLNAMHILPKHKYYDNGDRFYSCIHAQLRIGVNSLNSSLHSRLLKDSPLCECGEQDETVKHLLLKCPRYEQIRLEMFLNINLLYNSNIMYTANDKRKLSVLLFCDQEKPNAFNIKLCLLVQSFLIKTKRFKRRG